MKIDFLFIAEAVRREPSGALNAIGIFDQIVVPAFPYTHPGLRVAGRFRLSPGDVGKHAVRVVVVDSDGDFLTDATQDIIFSPADSGRSGYGSASFTLIISPVVFPESGEYAVEIFIDGHQAFTSPLLLGLAAPPV